MKKYKYGTVEVNAPANEASRLAEIVAVGIVEGETGRMEECLADNVELIESGSAALHGKGEVVKYFENIIRINKESGAFSEMCVMQSDHFRRTCVCCKGMIAAFDVEEGKITRLFLPIKADNAGKKKSIEGYEVFANEYLRGSLVESWGESVNVLYPLSDSVFTDSAKVTADRLPCAMCVCAADRLDWCIGYAKTMGFSVATCREPRHHIEDFLQSKFVSVCPHCHRVAEVFYSECVCMQYQYADVHAGSMADIACESALCNAFGSVLGDDTAIVGRRFQVSLDVFKDHTLKSGDTDSDKSPLLYFEASQSKGDAPTYSDIDILEELPDISLPEGEKIVVEPPHHDTFGSLSRLYVAEGDDNKDYDYLGHIVVSHTKAGAWQVYLLCTAYAYLPTYWHGARDVRFVILAASDVASVLDYNNDTPDIDVAALARAGKIEPEVVEGHDAETGGYTADVYCTYWNRWKGLVREHAQVMLSGGKVDLFYIVDSEVLCAYNCGIEF